MGKRIVATGSFCVMWDVADLREAWGEDITDEELLADCLMSLEQDWDQYATTPDSIHIEGELVG